MVTDQGILLIAVPITDKINGEVQPIMMDKTRSHPPAGIYLLAAILEHAGIPSTMLDMIAYGSISHDSFDALYLAHDIFAIPANSLNWPSVISVISRIRSINERAIIILGNIHGTIFPRHILENFDVNYIIRGEAENSFPDLIRALCRNRRPAPGEIPGLCFKEQGSVFVSDEKPVLTEEEFNRNIVPLWKILPKQAYSALSIESSRGCLFNCVFCSIPYRRSWRSLSARRFHENYYEAAAFMGRTRSNVMSITDDCFTLDKARVMEIVELFRRDGCVPQFTYDARASDFCDEELAEVLAPHSNAVLIGAEAGYSKGLRRIRKGITLRHMEESAGNAARLGIARKVVFSFILGFPWESYDEVLKTVDFAFELYARYGVQIYLQWHNLIPGSKVWYDFLSAEKLSLTDYDQSGFFRNEKLMGLSIGLSREKIYEICDRVISLMKLADIRDNLEHQKARSISFSVPWHLEQGYFNQRTLIAS